MDRTPEPLLPDLGELLGGRRGVIDATVPGVVLVLVDVGTSLWVAIGAAVASAAVLALVRTVRREPRRQAAMGLLGLAGAAVLAAVTGQAKAYFLPGILSNAGYGIACLVSIAVGRPLLGYVAAVLDRRRYAGWRVSPPLRRAATWATVAWTAVFVVRAAVMGWLYLHDQEGWLAGAKVALGLPLWVVAVAITLLLLESRTEAPAETGQARS